MSNFRVLLSLLALIFSNCYDVLESIIAVVGFWPEYRGIRVVRLSMKSIKMFTYTSLFCRAFSHIEGTSFYTSSSSLLCVKSYLAEYVMF